MVCLSSLLLPYFHASAAGRPIVQRSWDIGRRKDYAGPRAISARDGSRVAATHIGSEYRRADDVGVSVDASVGKPADQEGEGQGWGTGNSITVHRC